MHPKSIVARAFKSDKQKKEERDPLNYAAELALFMQIRNHGVNLPNDFIEKEWDGSKFIEQ